MDKNVYARRNRSIIIKKPVYTQIYYANVPTFDAIRG